MSFKEIFRRATPLAKIILVLIVLFAIVSVYILLWSIGVVDNIFISDVDATWICFSIISFGLATLIAAFHLSTMIFRRKRKADKATDMKKRIST